LKPVLLALVLCFSAALHPAETNLLTLAAQAEKLGDWQEALSDYQVAYSNSSDAKLLRNIGNCQAHLGRWRDASDSFEKYLLVHPEDGSMAAYEAKLKAGLSRRPVADAPAAAVAANTGVDGVTVFMKENPRDNQHVQITVEMLTPLIAGLDLGYYSSRHHDFGLGYVGFGSGDISGSLFHPRYRYHSARFYWDSFFELGGLFGGYKENESNGDYNQESMTGGDMGLGVDFKNNSPWTFNFLLSFNFVSLTNKTRTTDTYNTGYFDYNTYSYVYGTNVSSVREESSSIFVIYPLIGISFGFIF
jgi:tetratricopeptide (TPR) repeat protein